MRARDIDAYVGRAWDDATDGKSEVRFVDSVVWRIFDYSSDRFLEFLATFALS